MNVSTNEPKEARADRRPFLLLGATALGASAMASPCAAAALPRVRHLKSTPIPQPLREIRINNGRPRVNDRPTYLYSTLYSLRLPQLRRGDVVMVHSQFEATNDSPFDVVMFAHAVLLHDRETIYDHVAKKPADQVVCDYSGENITAGMHHGFRTLVGSFSAQRDGDAWVSTIVYAAHINANPDKHVLRIEGSWPGQDPYGDMRAIVFGRGEAR